MFTSRDPTECPPHLRYDLHFVERRVQGLGGGAHLIHHRLTRSLGRAPRRLAGDYLGVSNEDLETRLVALHDGQGRAEALRDKYRAALAWDEKERDQISADQRSRTYRLLGGQ